MIFQMGTRPGMRIFLSHEYGEANTKADKTNISVFASSPGGEVLAKVANGAYNLKALGRGWYDLELPATMFRTIGVGCYEVAPKSGRVWRDMFTVAFDGAGAVRNKANAA